jgi:predicted alpha-1,6-mannanase (GH76 family)
MKFLLIILTSAVAGASYFGFQLQQQHQTDYRKMVENLSSRINQLKKDTKNLKAKNDTLSQNLNQLGGKLLNAQKLKDELLANIHIAQQIAASPPLPSSPPTPSEQPRTLSPPPPRPSIPPAPALNEAGQLQPTDIELKADQSYAAFLKAFLTNSSAGTYFKTSIKDQTLLRSWGACLEIGVVEDVYERTFDPEQRRLLIALLDNAILPQNDGPVWTSWDGWNDDVAWMGIAFMRGFKLTGHRDYLHAVETNWNNTYKRGWDTAYGGGGIWECMDNLKPGGQPSKCALSNNPFILIGCELYEATGDVSYLTKSQEIYAWVRSQVFDVKTGQVNEGVAFQGYKTDITATLQPSDNVYNSGSFIEAANALYRETGDPMYFKDALLAINHIVNEGPILHNNAEDGGSQWAYRFIRGLSQFCTYNGYWNTSIPHYAKTYYDWVLGNANAAWSKRDSFDLTWNEWNRVTTDLDPKGVECSSAVAIWQELAMASKFHSSDP